MVYCALGDVVAGDDFETIDQSSSSSAVFRLVGRSETSGNPFFRLGRPPLTENEDDDKDEDD